MAPDDVRHISGGATSSAVNERLRIENREKFVQLVADRLPRRPRLDEPRRGKMSPKAGKTCCSDSGGSGVIYDNHLNGPATARQDMLSRRLNNKGDLMRMILFEISLPSAVALGPDYKANNFR
ncbi:hypothetical protein E4U21_001538 [Claviceps maximensis]|nr:hypothetical protein E4U21_001538 [Claviceps maximensis]